MNMQDAGFRFIHRAGGFIWIHPAQVMQGDTDCTDFNDDQFYEFVKENFEFSPAEATDTQASVA